tara:strand:+ start:2965 stop:3654 length:690 start_codon:yes stop_codon:yes gene_type:complete
MSNAVVYTSVFGKYDEVSEHSLPNNWDWKYFNEKNSLSLYTDNTRNAKRFKILPHRYLQNYEYSLWVDGNYLVTGNIDKLVEKYLSDCNVAFFSHNHPTILDPRNCIYEEAKVIFQLGEKNMRLTPERGRLNYKDNPEVIKKQIDKYHMVGYPSNNGLIFGSVILRRHNEPDCIKVMEHWWSEIKHNSRRDQLSFNYVAWKNNLKFNYMEGDPRDNEYMTMQGAHKGKK